MSWTGWFPYDEFRPFQESTLTLVRDAFEVKKKRFVVLQAPTGSGKSSTAISIAKHFGSAYLTVPMKFLQDQYEGDFTGLLADIKGKSNYACSFSWQKRGHWGDVEHSCGTAPCGLNRRSKQEKMIQQGCAKEGTCPYLSARSAAIVSPLTLLNFSNLLAFFSLKTAPKIWFEPRDLLVVDECHLLESRLFDYCTVTLSMDTMKPLAGLLPLEAQAKLKRGFGSAKQVYDFMMDYVRDPVARLLKEEPDPTEEGDQPDPNEITKLANQIDLLEQQFHKREWVAKTSEMSTTISPVTIDFLSPMAFKAASKVLLMSATILDCETFCKSLGIDLEEVEYINVPSTFPAENRPIYYQPVGKMSKANIEATMPKMVDKVRELLEEHSTHKGIIHTYNYRIAKALSEAIPDSRMLYQTQGENKELLVRRHLSSKEPTVLVGPGFKEGLDLKGNLCRFQIVPKMPYLDMGDPVIKKRQDMDPRWYAMMTAIDFIQEIGRGMRSADDWCMTYVLDEGFHSFRCYNGDLLPPEIHSALHL